VMLGAVCNSKTKRYGLHFGQVCLRPVFLRSKSLLYLFIYLFYEKLFICVFVFQYYLQVVFIIFFLLFFFLFFFFFLFLFFLFFYFFFFIFFFIKRISDGNQLHERVGRSFEDASC
jgi:hypothetical protein